MKQISILGCGWLGFPLAKSLLDKGFSVNGSTTSESKLSLLENSGISAFQITINENEIVGNIEVFLETSEILIIDIPPKLRGNSTENFVAKIKTILPYIEQSTIEKVIFISSTSVYEDNNSEVNENTKPQPETESGKQLLESEQLLVSNTYFQTTIVRFGGLIGEDRNPVKMLSGKQNIQNPEAPINLIHQNDCIGIIQKIIETESYNEIFNAVMPFHPTRKEYYTKKALAMNLPLPEFDYSKPSIGKKILSNKIETILEYTFLVPNQ